MTRNEALKQFFENEAMDEILSMNRNVQAMFSERIDDIFQVFSYSFFALLNRLANNRRKISCIEYSFMLSRLMHGGDVLLLEALDKYQYTGLTPPVAKIEFDLQFLFEPWLNALSNLKHQCKKYIGLIIEHDVNSFMLQHYSEITKLVAQLLMFFFQQPLIVSLIDMLPTNNEFSIWCGIYRSTAMRVFYKETKTEEYGLFHIETDSDD